MQTPLRGAILIADITGYSAYLNESELEHAEQTLAELLELLVTHTRPPIIVSKLEGDAVLSYLIDSGSLRGQAFAEVIESLYVDFRRALELMVLNSTCGCNACANIGTLDLKFFVHHGEFVVSQIAGRGELQGSDVNLLHRLVKNRVTAETGIRAYVLYTQQAVDALDLGELAASMTPHVNTYDDVGRVEAWVEDLTPVWEARRSASSIELDDTLVGASTTIDLPLEVVWGYLIDPEYRSTLIGSDRQEVDDVREGRIAEGSVYQCYHGDKVMPQVILEWTPLERIVTRDRSGLPRVTMYFIAEYRLERTTDGTQLSKRATVDSGSWLAMRIGKMMMKTLPKLFQRSLDAFRDHVEDAYRTERETLATVP